MQTNYKRSWTWSSPWTQTEHTQASQQRASSFSNRLANFWTNSQGLERTRRFSNELAGSRTREFSIRRASAHEPSHSPRRDALRSSVSRAGLCTREMHRSHLPSSRRRCGSCSACPPQDTVPHHGLGSARLSTHSYTVSVRGDRRPPRASLFQDSCPTGTGPPPSSNTRYVSCCVVPSCWRASLL